MARIIHGKGLCRDAADRRERRQRRARKCQGEPEESQSAETFTSEDAAMEFYKANIRPRLERLMAEASRKVKDGTFMHRLLE